MTQPNTRLADELRRGGIALLAEAVAELVKNALAGDVIDMIEFQAEMERRVAAIPPGDVAQRANAHDCNGYKAAVRTVLGVEAGMLVKVTGERDEALAKLSASEARVRELEAEVDKLRTAHNVEIASGYADDLRHDATKRKLAEAERTIAELRTELGWERGWDLHRKAAYAAVVDAARARRSFKRAGPQGDDSEWKETLHMLTLQIDIAVSALDESSQPPVASKAPGDSSDLIESWPQGHPWQFDNGSPHWVRVKATGQVGMVCDSDRCEGKLWFALHNSAQCGGQWFLPSELEASDESSQPRVEHGYGGGSDERDDDESSQREAVEEPPWCARHRSTFETHEGVSVCPECASEPSKGDES